MFLLGILVVCAKSAQCSLANCAALSTRQLLRLQRREGNEGWPGVVSQDYSHPHKCLP